LSGGITQTGGVVKFTPINLPSWVRCPLTPKRKAIICMVLPRIVNGARSRVGWCRKILARHFSTIYQILIYLAITFILLETIVKISQKTTIFEDLLLWVEV
jgi:hypothetical protein